MKIQSVLPRWSSLLCFTAFATFLYCSYGAIAAEGPPEKTAQRADIILIETVEAKKAEYPPAVFPHAPHEKAVMAQGNDCSSCHTDATDGKLTFAFKESATIADTDLKDYYHATCAGCHDSYAAKGVKTGPTATECRSCHMDTPPVNTGWNEVPFSKILHNQHIEAKAAIPNLEGMETNCGACHASYDENMNRIPYVPGTEQSCYTCHYNDADFKAAAIKEAAGLEAAKKAGTEASFEKDPKLANGLTIGQISHSSCVSCHLTVSQQQPDILTGPVSCAGCHGDATVAALKAANSDKNAIKTTPRLMRNQPDSTLIVPKSNNAGIPEGGMGLVSFDHKLHEQVTLDCRTCHHKSITACGTCHTLEGTAKTNFINIAKAMHDPNSNRSCVGCHNQVKKEPECAGCHVVMPQEKLPARSCATCHTTKVTNVTGNSVDMITKMAQKPSKNELDAIALYTTNNRQHSTAGIVSFNDIPETVTLGLLSNEFKPSVMPHRAIVKKLAEGVAGSKLAASFHTVDTSLCMGCHHNSPASVTPPACVSCHSVGTATGTVSGIPELKVAYHQQCIGCHTEMNQPPLATECADCHEPVKR